jgi:integrase
VGPARGRDQAEVQRRQAQGAHLGRAARLSGRAGGEDGRTGTDRLFGATETRPFNGIKLSERADTAWESAKLDRITLHECRHTFASLMIAAGVNAKALATFMGHAAISITLDRYGHLMPGNEKVAAGLLDEYLVRAEIVPV